MILCLALPALTMAQIKVTGYVTDLQNLPVSDVIVKLLHGRKTLAFGSSDKHGVYTLELKSTPEGETTLQFSHISYEKESEPVTLKDKDTIVDMILTPKSISLKEVMVRPDPLWQRGDTLSHNLASFLGKGDVTLEDGLKRLPGVNVSASGSISYMGTAISQFNIEGQDLLGGKYNISTRNIPADYVNIVEIVRNHHSRRVDRDVPSNEVSINIRLAQKAKFKPFGQEEAGISPVPSSSKGKDHDRVQGLLGITGMMFTDKFQTICSLKGGNYKNFARDDMIDHFGGSGIGTSATGLFGGFSGGAPPQGEYLYQRNGMVTLNGICELDSATTVKINADYSYHRATHDITRSSTYLTGDGNYVTVNEQTSPLSTTHLPMLSLNYLKNADRAYLNETFMIRGKFERNEGNILSNGSMVEQHRRTSSFEVGNSIFWEGKSDNDTRRHVSGNMSFKRTPTLRLSFTNDGQSYGQTAQSSTLSMRAATSFNIPIGKLFRLSLPVSIDALYDILETDRVPYGEVNDIRGWSLSPSVGPGGEIYSRNRRFYLSASLGAKLKLLYYNRIHYIKPVLNPSLDMSYTFSANSKLSFSTRYTTTVGDMMALLTEPMQVDYRTVRTSSGIIGETDSWHTSCDWKWQIPMKYFTFGIKAGHTETKRNTLYSQSISHIDITNNAMARDTRSRSTGCSINATKNFPSIFTKISTDAGYNFGNGEQAVNSDIIKVRSNSYNVHGNVSVSPLSWLELGYDIRYGRSHTIYSDKSNKLTSLSHSGAIHVFPISALDISVNYDHVRHQIAVGRYKQAALFNASAQYKLKRLIFRLELDNLLNKRHYAYTVFDGINTYSYDYSLCGRTTMLIVRFQI